MACGVDEYGTCVSQWHHLATYGLSHHSPTRLKLRQRTELWIDVYIVHMATERCQCRGGCQVVRLIGEMLPDADPRQIVACVVCLQIAHEIIAA